MLNKFTKFADVITSQINCNLQFNKINLKATNSINTAKDTIIINLASSSGLFELKLMFNTIHNDIQTMSFLANWQVQPISTRQFNLLELSTQWDQISAKYDQIITCLVRAFYMAFVIQKNGAFD